MPEDVFEHRDSRGLTATSNVDTVTICGVELSTKDLVHVFLIQLLAPEEQITTSFREADLKRLYAHYDAPQELERYRHDANKKLLTQNDILTLMMRLNLVATPSVSDGDGLPIEIAVAIASVYYENLELTVQDIQQVITEHLGLLWIKDGLTLENIEDEFISKIVHASIDEHRMELRAILPYESIIKDAVEGLKHPPLNPLTPY